MFVSGLLLLLTDTMTLETPIKENILLWQLVYSSEVQGKMNNKIAETGLRVQ